MSRKQRAQHATADPRALALAAFLASHLLSLAILVAGWLWQQRLEVDAGLPPVSLRQFWSQWDAGWFLTIVADGYPARLPLDEAGAVAQNPWAFLPGFPMLVRGVAGLLGTDPLWTGIVINQAATLIAVLALIDLVRRVQPQSGLTGPALALGVFAASPVLWMFYSEALFLAIVAAVLDLLVAGRFWPALVLSAVACTVRPVGAALVATTVAVAAHRLLSDRRERRGLRPGAWRLVIAAVIAVGAGVFWPITAWAATGETRALFLSYRAWGADGTPVIAWLPFFRTPYEYLGLVCVIAAATILWLRGGQLPFPLRAYGWIYLAALVLLGWPSSSTVRHLLGLVPLFLVVDVTRAVLGWWAIFLTAKLWWVFDLVVIGNLDSPP